MERKYVKRYKVYKVSSDGIIKHPQKEEAYYTYAATWLDAEYESEQDAINDIVKYDVGDCIITTCIVTVHE